MITFSKKKNSNKIISGVEKAFGGFFLFLSIFGLFDSITYFTTVERLIYDIFSCLFLLLISMGFFTKGFSFDDSNITFHILFIKKDYPIYTFLEIKYFIFGVVLISGYRDTLNNKYTFPVALLCTKKRCVNKLSGFLEVVKRKNMSCVIDI